MHGAEGFPLAEFFVAVTPATVLLLGALSVAGLWIPPAWWRALAIGGAALSVVLTRRGTCGLHRETGRREWTDGRIG